MEKLGGKGLRKIRSSVLNVRLEMSIRHLRKYITQAIGTDVRDSQEGLINITHVGIVSM